MGILLVTLLVLGGLAAIIVFWLVAVYNGLIRLRNQVDEAWSDIDVQLKRRHDLIPNLLESVKGYMNHEKELLEKITQYRSQAISAQEAGDTAAWLKLKACLVTCWEIYV